MKKSKKNNTFLIASSLIIIIGLIIGVVLVQKQTSLSSKASFNSYSTYKINTPTTIRNDNDLKSAFNDLDSTDLDSLDYELNRISEDSSSF